MAKTFKEIKAKIMTERKYVDIKPYSHNIISCLLRQADEEIGKGTAIKLIKQCKLEKLGWSIPKSPSPEGSG